MRGYQKNLHYIQDTPKPTTTTNHCDKPTCISMLATTIHKSNTTPHHQSRATTLRLHQRRATPKGTGLLSQSPIVCPAVILDQETNPRKDPPDLVSCLLSNFMHQTPTHYR